MGRLIAPPVLVATRSPHKLAEIRTLLAHIDVRFVGPDDLGLPVLEEEEELEPFDTFEQNALSKAKYFHARAGLPTLADDSGLCVDALEGGPGVRTKRFAPDDWVERYGRVRGRIGNAPQGSGGFGYDPLFLPEGEELPYASLPESVKEATSHRARAALAAVPWIERHVLRPD